MEITVRKAKESDADLLLEWSNDPLTRHNSFNSKEIKKSDHYQWYFRKLKDQNSMIYFFDRSKVSIGVVRFDLSGHVVIGVNVAPSERGKGFGTELIRRGCEVFWQSQDADIFAYIKDTNIASIKSFEKAGFKIVKQTQYMDIPCFVLKAVKNENRKF